MLHNKPKSKEEAIKQLTTKGFLDSEPMSKERMEMPLESTNVPIHFHTTDRIDFRDLLKRKLYISHTIVGTAAATAANYSIFWIAPFECVVSEIREVHQTAGSSADAALQIEKLTGTQALDNGVTLNTAIELDGAANTVVTATLTSTLADLNLSRGNRLAMKDAGTLTAVANVTVVIEITF